MELVRRCKNKVCSAIVEPGYPCSECGYTSDFRGEDDANAPGYERYRMAFDAHEANRPAFTTLDSGQREEYATGARRDTQEGKPRYDLLPVEALTRWAALMARGAEKYGDRNWEKGIPTDRFYASAFRHLMQWRQGDTTEDHLAACLFNVAGIIFNQEQDK